MCAVLKNRVGTTGPKNRSVAKDLTKFRGKNKTLTLEQQPTIICMRRMPSVSSRYPKLKAFFGFHFIMIGKK